MKIKTSLLILLIAPFSSAWETEPLACYYELKLNDKRYSQIEEKINSRIATGLLEAATKASPGRLSSLVSSAKCDEEAWQSLRKAILDKLGDTGFKHRGVLEVFVRDEIPERLKCSIKYEDSSYYPLDKRLEGTSIVSVSDLMPGIRMCGTNLGSDKLSHFFVQGFDFYNRAKTSKSLLHALQESSKTEEGDFGLASTHTKSYADLAANYSGGVFYRDIEQYFQCHEGKFVYKNNFNICNHIQPAWDEAINCNEYASVFNGKKNPVPLEKYVKRRAAARAKEYKKISGAEARRFDCPIEANECLKVHNYYSANIAGWNKISESITTQSDWEDHLMHNYCLVAAKNQKAQELNKQAPEVTNKKRPATRSGVSR